MNKNATDKLRAINIDSRDKDLKINADGSVDLYIGPKSPKEKKATGYKPMLVKVGFHCLERMVQNKHFLIKLWRPGDFELV